MIRKELGSKITILYDSGIRSGEDIVKALALGANFVFLGRPFLFSCAVGHSPAINHLIGILEKQVDTTLAQIGCTSLEDLNTSVMFSDK